MKGDIAPGTRVLINGLGDIGMESEYRSWIGKEGTVVRKTRAGLYIVENDESKTLTFAKRNLDPVI